MKVLFGISNEDTVKGIVKFYEEKYKEKIEDYMAREVLPHIPDAKAFFEENLAARKPVIKTGAEIPFTRHFYKYLKPCSSSQLAAEFKELEGKVTEAIGELF